MRAKLLHLAAIGAALGIGTSVAQAKLRPRRRQLGDEGAAAGGAQ